MHEGEYVQRDLDGIAADIDSMPRGHLGLLDANPAENGAYAASLFPVLRRSGRTWFASASLKCASDAQWVKAARASGCRGLVIGFESLDAASLASAGKSFNDVARYGETCRMLHDEGIVILGCFIFGFDGEKRSVFERTVEFVDRQHVDVALYSVYTPFPGTGGWARLNSERRLLSTDWSRYDGRHVVFKPVGMTVDELQDGIYYAWNQTYTLGSILKRVTGSATMPFLDLAVTLVFRHYRHTFVPPKSATLRNSGGDPCESC